MDAFEKLMKVLTISKELSIFFEGFRKVRKVFRNLEISESFKIFENFQDFTNLGAPLRAFGIHSKVFRKFAKLDKYFNSEIFITSKGYVKQALVMPKTLKNLLEATANFVNFKGFKKMCCLLKASRIFQGFKEVQYKA